MPSTEACPTLNNGILSAILRSSGGASQGTHFRPVLAPRVAHAALAQGACVELRVQAWRCAINRANEHSEHEYSVITPSSEIRVHGEAAAMKHAAEASLGSCGSVEVVRDDGRLTMIYWEGSLQGVIRRRAR